MYGVSGWSSSLQRTAVFCGVRTALQVRSEAKKQQIHGWNVSAQGTAHSVGDGE
jgi:hypothetical protein